MTSHNARALIPAGPTSCARWVDAMSAEVGEASRLRDGAKPEVIAGLRGSRCDPPQA